MRFEAPLEAAREADSPLAGSPLLPVHLLVKRLRVDQPLRRVGIVELAPAYLGCELNWAAQLAFCGLTPFDYAAHLRAHLSPSARFVGLTATGLLDHLGALTRGSADGAVSTEVAPFGLGAALLLFNFDLALCLLPGEGRAEFWSALAGEAFPRGSRALLLALPTGAPVGPEESLLSAWQVAERVARLG